MKQIKLNLPKLKLGQIKVTGQLWDTQDPVYLDQDILDIKLPNGNSIDVGWHPESDPNGSFRIVVYRDYWSNQLTDPITTKDAFEVPQIVYQLAEGYSKPIVIMSCSKETRHERYYKSLSRPRADDTCACVERSFHPRWKFGRKVPSAQRLDLSRVRRCSPARRAPLRRSGVPPARRRPRGS